VIGSFLGGTFADPVSNYPDLFPADQWPFLVQYPFILPNLFAATVVIMGMLIGLLFFHETHPTVRYQRDRGLEAGDWLVRLFTGKLGRQPHQRHKAKRSDVTGSVDLSSRDEEAEGLLDEDIELTHSPTSSTPGTRSPGTPASTNEKIATKASLAFDREVAVKAANPSVRKAFTTQVCLNIAALGVLAL
jgi:hypothetical protein